MAGMQDTVRALDKEGVEVRVLRNSLDASLSKAITVTEATQNRSKKHMHIHMYMYTIYTYTIHTNI
jgi:hypothetical protein